MCPFAREKTPLSHLRLFFAGSSLLLLLDTIDTSEYSFFDIIFVYNRETKLKQWISQNTEEKILYCTHCHTNMSEAIWLLYIILNYDFIMQCFLTRQRKITKNAVVDSDDEDDNIFEPERSLFGNFNTFVRQWCAKNNKNLFKLAFWFQLFTRFL